MHVVYLLMEQIDRLVYIILTVQEKLCQVLLETVTTCTLGHVSGCLAHS